ncbi:MAG: hypothetical protein HFF01_08800 [Erysipelotrichaceae bacterium]|nr:hypothetical protein [Erysipelotrichaceae bacterium]
MAKNVKTFAMHVPHPTVASEKDRFEGPLFSFAIWKRRFYYAKILCDTNAVVLEE